MNYHHRQQHSPRRLVVAVVGFVIFSSFGLAADTGSIEQTLRKLDQEWSAAAAARNLDKVVSYYAVGAIVLPPNMPAARDAEAIRNVWKGELETMISGGWKVTRVEVAKSGDMAYASGTYDWVGKGADGKEVKDRGKYLEVWKKQADGTWKCTADSWNSDLPLPGTQP